MHAVSGEALGQARIGVRARMTCGRDTGPSSGLDLGAATDFVQRLYECIREMNQAAEMPPEQAALVAGSVLHASFPVYLQCRFGNPERASDALFHIWADHASVLGVGAGIPAQPAPVAASLEPTHDIVECLTLFNVAIGQCLRQENGAAEARRVVRRLLTVLDLSFDELGQMLGVRGETVRRWERGLVPVPLERLAALTNTEAALDRLIGHVRPERLPLAIRRPAELFGGETALTWILRGRIDEVADRYDRVLAYQQ